MKSLAMKLLQPLFKNSSYTIRNGIAKGLRRRGGLGFVPKFTAPGKEERFFTSLDLDGTTVYDVGGYVGITTLFFARAVGERGQVITFEPNPQNYRMILENVRLNKFDNRVRVFNIGLSAQRKNTQLLVDRNDDAGTGRIQDKADTNRGEDKDFVSLDIEVDTLDNMIQSRNLTKPDFVKIDVEGHEMDVLLGMRQTLEEHRPQLYIEIHGSDTQDKMKNIRKVAEHILARGYAIYHLESENEITSVNAETALRGHIYSCANREVLLRAVPGGDRHPASG
ncbi:MAG TPA: FkbM family methyltransferase [Candidatus Methanoperedens sp.]|nr:FkbM family methyltransferase [Candidatus Methanoperedens sp.]